MLYAVSGGDWKQQYSFIHRFYHANTAFAAASILPQHQDALVDEVHKLMGNAEAHSVIICGVQQSSLNELLAEFPETHVANLDGKHALPTATKTKSSSPSSAILRS